MFNSLRVRLVILFVLWTTIPLASVGAQIAWRGSNTLQKQSVEAQNQLARQTAISLKDFFSERQNELFVLTDVYGLASLDRDAQKNILATLVIEQPAYYELKMVMVQPASYELKTVDVEGQETIRVTRGEMITDKNLASHTGDPLFQAAIQTHATQFSSVYFHEQARDRMMTLAMPVENLYTGEVGYVLMAEIRFQNIQETVLRNLDLGEGEDVYILDSNGVVIAHQNPNMVLKETVFKLPANDGRYTGLTGGDVILARDTLQLANLELNVVSEIPYDKATALASELTQVAATITVLTVLIAIVVSVYFGLRMFNPINKIAHVAEAIQGGDLSAKADETRNDEIGTLGRAFNKMTAQLQQTLTGLQDNIDKLEKARVEREKLIKDLQTAKRLAEENSRLKSEFLSTMSHELRTPMNAIEGFTSIMLKHMGGVDYNDKTERFLNKVQSNSQRLLHLINDFLDLSRIESGRVELARLPISPAQMVQQWKSELGVLGSGKDISFEAFVDPNMPEVIYGDEEALSKIATNLIGNAFKFTSEGQVTLTLERRDSQMAIQVTDTGIGIPIHAREFIFDEFRQVDQSSKRKYGGTGLGLAIVQKLAREMGGTVTLESEVGKGSTFTVLLPIETEGEKEYV